MMNAWNTVIFMKSNKHMNDMNAMAKWDGVESIWSTTGEWDWCVKMDAKSSSPENAEAMVAKMREGHWASETKTNWWRQVSSK
jgi:hypothetical protein